jgi:hypothetical protein
MLIGPAPGTIKLNFRIANQKPARSTDTHSHLLLAIQEFEMKSASIWRRHYNHSSFRAVLRIATHSIDKFILAS